MQKYSEEQLKLIEDLNKIFNPIEDSYYELEYIYEELKSKLEKYKRGDFS